MAAVVGNGVIAGRWDNTVAFGVDEGKMPVGATHFEEQLSAFFTANPVQVAGSTVAIHVIEGQRISMDIKSGCGYQHIGAADLSAPAGAQAAIGSATHVQAGFGAEALAAPGHDIDHAEHGIATIYRRTGATDDFDAFDQADVQGKCRIAWRTGENVLVDGHPINQDLQTRAVVTRLRDAANTGITVSVVVGDIEPL